MIKAIIIDDEHYGREALKTALEKYCPQVKVVAICEDPEQGINAIKANHPDLVFLDIQMPQMSGFDLLNSLEIIDFKVIFVTSFNHYAIKAIRFSALDYLLKPIDIDDLVRAVNRAEEKVTGASFQHKFQSVLNNLHYDVGQIEQLAVPTQHGIDLFKTDQIIFCQADGSYTVLYLVGKKSEIVSRNLRDFEQLLMHSGFCRVHNSYLINIRHVQKYIKGEGGYVILTDGHHVDISRRKKEEFLKLLHKV